MKQQWYAKKWVVIAMHIAAWTLLFSLPFLLRPSYENAHNHNDSFSLIKYVITGALWAGFFYLNAYFLMPKFIYKKRYWEFVLLQLIIFVLQIIFDWILFETFLTERTYELKPAILFVFFPYIFILATSTAYRMISDKIKYDHIFQQKEKENLTTELSFLRSQVSPHFMFNVLNNMVALARKKSDLLEASLIKLSSLMRYMLYEADEEKVPLEKEIEYLQSYIDLQQQRFGNNVAVQFNAVVPDKNYHIEPMLLIPFVENAFKHGTGMIEHATITIELKAANNWLHFMVRNKYNPTSIEVKDKTSGIGLTNVERRLKLLYGESHTLAITKNDAWFIVTLQLNFHE
ncbi:histidine kinase [Hydrotalea sp.]|uniref:sensor histidine kinase n=1 Tax=Hydrotalea sp. TaxID=2881279 RepID=UPI002603E2A6|nr:histidine kinase [Hydrotalea sp.]